MRRPALMILAMGILIGNSFDYAYAEEATFKSAIIWSEEEGADYPLPILVNARYEIPEAIPADGQIQSIIANYKFSGEVILEVSADGGLHYAPIVNGVPLLSGFVSGDRLKWRARALSKESRLTELRISYTDSSGAAGDFGSAQLSGFKFRKPIYINGPPQGNLFNYQIKINVGESEKAQEFDAHCEGKAQNTFRDIRFTASDAQTLLPYYLEKVKGSSPKQTALYWVKVPHIPKQGVVLYLYYGNAQANSLSGPKEVFDFFEHFSGFGLERDIWDTALAEGASYGLSDSKLELDAGEIISKGFQFRDGIIEYSAAVESGSGYGLIVKKEKGSLEASDTTSQATYSSTYKGAEHCIVVGDIVKANDPKPISYGTKYDYRIIAKGSQVIFERYTKDFKELEARATFNIAGGGLKKGYLGLKSLGEGRQNNVSAFDWLRVRRLGFNEEGIYVDRKKTISQPQEEVSLPIFKGITLAKNGNLALADNYTEGSFTSGEISAGFPVRIIVPEFTQAEGVSLDISTDSGKAYKRGFQRGIYYYASKGDFNPGNNLKYRIGISGKQEIDFVSLDFRKGSITLISPNGGELLEPGKEYKITWSALDYAPDYPMDLEYSLDNGRTYQVIAIAIENKGSFLWKAPETVSDAVQVKVRDHFDKAIYDTSDRSFTVK